MVQEIPTLDSVFIYGLIDPRDRKIRYVGKSTNPYARKENHLAEARMQTRRGGRRLIWLRELLEAKIKPEVAILECVHGFWEEREKAWIAAIPGLLNSHPGGAGGWSHLTPEQRLAAGKKGGAAGKGSKRDEGFRINQRLRGKAEGSLRSDRLQSGRKGSVLVQRHMKQLADRIRKATINKMKHLYIPSMLQRELAQKIGCTRGAIFHCLRSNKLTWEQFKETCIRG